MRKWTAIEIANYKITNLKVIPYQLDASTQNKDQVIFIKTTAILVTNRIYWEGLRSKASIKI